jgi:hypothetical protein
MSIRLAHIINPFLAEPNSDLAKAQPITFETMRRAKAFASPHIEVDLLSAQFHEDRSMVPSDFIMTEDLQRSILDLQTFDPKIKLPILRDILDQAYAFHQADYIIYTNVDIAVHLNFYVEVAKKIQTGLDAFIINRRRISEDFEGVQELDIMYSLKGKPHPGFDCFVFRRSLYPAFSLANICVGIPYVGITLAQNLFALSTKCVVFTDDILTFHLGLVLYSHRAPKAYVKYNHQEFRNAISGLWDHLDTRRWPHGKRWILPRYYLWAIHPSLPILLAIKLEVRRYKFW